MEKMLLLILFLGFSGPLFAQAGWTLEKEKDGIKVYLRTRDNLKIKEFKAETVMETSIESLLAIMLDFESHKNWMANTNTSKLLEQKDDFHFLMYYQLEFPWPLNNRDIVNQVIIQADRDKKEVRFLLHSSPDSYPAQPQVVRMRRADGYWIFQADGSNKTKVSYVYLAYPGRVPAWTVNLFITNTSLETLQNMASEAQKPAHSKVQIPWFQ